MSSRLFVRSSESVAEARQFVAETLDQISEDLRSVVILLVSELATNALLHGPNGFEVSVAYSPNIHLVRVGGSDPGDGRPTVEHPEITAEHGRGLQLVGALSDRWGIESVPGAPGKTVWFELTEAAVAAGVDGEIAIGTRPPTITYSSPGQAAGRPKVTRHGAVSPSAVGEGNVDDDGVVEAAAGEPGRFLAGCRG